jgi:hypothetical protein
MEKCQKKDLLYNAVTKRCYKACEQKNKVTHPVTKKCRQPCKSEKIRRAEDFRCVKSTTKKSTTKKNAQKVYQKRPLKTKEQITKGQIIRAEETKAKEELIPPPLQKELQKNFQFLDHLLAKGKDKMVKYDGSMVSEFITVYFHDKYKQHCPMYPIKTYSYFDTEDYKKYYNKNKKNFTEAAFKEELLKKDKYYYSEWNKDKFLKNLKLCLETGEQLILIPLRIPRHLNMLIIKASTREIIRFEPHGTEFDNESEENKTNTFLEKLTTNINTYLNLADNRRFTYVKPSKICPNYNTKLPHWGFQAMESYAMEHGKDEGKGFCQLWSWFFAECVIQNPEMDVKEVYKEAFNALRTDANNYATIIRGYFYSINNELKKMKKKFTIQKTKRLKYGRIDILLDYLNQSQVNLKNKDRKPFTGGKKHAFILPKANPQAAPVHFKV